MALTRDEKNELIEQLSTDLANAKSVIFTEYRGITMKDTQNLRKKLKKGNIDYKVIKTTLLQIAMKNAGLNAPDGIMNKPMAIAYGSEDEVMPAKLISEGAKDIEALKILGGLVNGEYLEAAGVKQLALLPSREQLLGQLVGTLAAPMSGLVGVLQGNFRGLVSVLKQREGQLS